MVNVSWEDAKSYVEWLSGKTGKEYRLLSRVGMGICGASGEYGAVSLWGYDRTDMRTTTEIARMVQAARGCIGEDGTCGVVFGE